MTNATDRCELSPRIPDLLLPWYRQNARDLPWRHDTDDPYRICLSEIMLQQTRVGMVIPYYLRFLDEVPSIRALALLDEERLLKLWEGLGYYSRARNLQKTARLIVREYNGIFPDTLENIRALPGIGPYTAGAIASICFGLPTPAVDGNVLRVVARICAIADEIETPAVKNAIADQLAALYPRASRDDTGDFTQALMELGATICLPNGLPRCAACPVASLCRAKRENAPEKYPVKRQKRAQKTEEITVFLLSREGRTAIRKRPDCGLLANMWELPNVTGRLSKEEAVSLLAAWGLRLAAGASAASIDKNDRRHVFTHVVWQMTCYRIVCDTTSDAFRWVAPEELRQTYSLPTAFRKCLQ